MSGSCVSIHDGHVDVHEDNSVPFRTIAFLRSVTVDGKLLHCLSTVQGGIHFEVKLAVEQHRKRHQVEGVVVYT